MSKDNKGTLRKSQTSFLGSPSVYWHRSFKRIICLSLKSAYGPVLPISNSGVVDWSTSEGWVLIGPASFILHLTFFVSLKLPEAHNTELDCKYSGWFHEENMALGGAAEVGTTRTKFQEWQVELDGDLISGTGHLNVWDSEQFFLGGKLSREEMVLKVRRLAL